VTPSVALVEISRAFGSTQALDSATLIAYPGRIHALVGENGAGKSTLMNVLAGRLKPDSGRIEIDGVEQAIGGEGVGMVSQHYSLIGPMSCWENVALCGGGLGMVSPKAVKERAAELAKTLSFAPDWDMPAQDLAPGAAQKLEIVKLLWQEARILILDEPTAMLSPADADALYAALRVLANSGCTVIVVTHRLAEVLTYADDVTALRGGRPAGSAAAKELNAQSLARMIVGVSDEAARPSATWVGPNVLELKGAAAGAGRAALKRAELSVRQGELIGLAGVEGSGQAALFRLLQGLEPARSGDVMIFGQPAAGLSARQRIQLGLRSVAEDRLAVGVAPDWSLADNAIMGLQCLPELRQGPFIHRAEQEATALAALKEFDARYARLDQPVHDLSGGNQQRLVVGRALRHGPKLILAYQPARGLDIQAIRRVYDAFAEACAQGAAVIVVSYDLDELLENCSRVAVACAGVITFPPPGRELDRELIGRMMVDAA
jgi:simple sugar transport system ATP-binding protein